MKIIKNTEPSVQKYRFLIQVFFVIICLWIGVDFYLFVSYLESGGATQFFNRPPGAEAFLPISSLMSVYYFFLTGDIHSAHPAGFFILIAIIVVSLIFGRSFCSWICPVGFLSELIGDFGDKFWKKLFKKKVHLPKFLDYPLRSLKYLLLGFFAYSIFFVMSEPALKSFLDSPYNIISDVKMFYFFANISRFSLIVIAILFVLSIFFRNFWCRYLCPYGAFLGIFTLLSPNKIKRNESSCIDCNKCTKVCPSLIKVDKVKTVISDECTTCLSCVDVCPVKNTLYLESAVTKKKFSKKAVGFTILIIYFSITGLGILSGNWQNNVSKEEYLRHYQSINTIGHPRSTKEIEKLNKISEEKADYGNEKNRD